VSQATKPATQTTAESEPTSIRDAAAGPRDPVWEGQLGLFREEKATVIQRFEKAYLEKLFAHHHRNITHAAAAAGVERHHLRKLLRKHGLLPPK